MERIDVDDGVYVKMTPQEIIQYCKAGQGSSCCAFISMGGDRGLGCCRMTSLAATINERLKAGLMKAKGVGGWPGCYWEEKLH